MTYNILSLKKIYNSSGEDFTKEMLNNFECYLNKDVESFLKEKAIQFSKQGIAETFLVTTLHNDENIILGYFVLANKTAKLENNMFKGAKKRRFLRFAHYDAENHYYFISLPLIGQLGKNYKNGYNELISGDILLKLACDKIREAQEILGGRFIFLECEDKHKLKAFYSNNGFVCFGKRQVNDKNYLLQMLCDLSN